MIPPKAADWTLNPDSNGISSVGISQDGKVVVAGTVFFNDDITATKTNEVGLYAYDEKQTLLWHDIYPATAPVHVEGTATTLGNNSTGGVSSVALTRDGKWAAGGGFIAPGVGYVYFYDVQSATGNRSSVFGAADSPSDRVNAVALSADGTVLVSGADSIYISFRNGGNWTTKKFPTPAAVGSVAISQDGGLIVAAAMKGNLLIVENTNGTIGGLNMYGPLVLPPGGGGAIQSVAITGNKAQGYQFVAASTVRATPSTKASAAVYYFTAANFKAGVAQTNPNPNPWEWTLPLKSNTNPPIQCVSCRGVSISPDGKSISAMGTVPGPIPADPTQKSHGSGMAFLFNDTATVTPNGTPAHAGTLTWTSAENEVAHSPNSLSMDDSGTHLAVTDGTKNSCASAGHYLFAPMEGPAPANGHAKWQNKTGVPSFPVAISADGKTMFAATDHGDIYYYST
jgi:hypothetical protein